MKTLRILVAALAVAAPAQALAQHTHGHGSSETSRREMPAPSSELRQEVEAVRAATERYRDHANAVRDGYKRFGAEGPVMGEHWYREDLVRQPLDLRRPSTLQYATIDGRRVLVGVAYTVYRRPDEGVPAGFAGDSDHWHTHDVAKMARAFVADRPFLRWVVNRRIERGKLGAGDGKTLLTMVHAWVWLENPDGLFAQQHRALPYLRAGLPAVWASGAGDDAAQGVALLAPRACPQEIARTDRLARLSGRQGRELTAACESAAAAVRAALTRDRSAVAVNVAATEAWTGFQATQSRILTREQVARVEQVMGAAMEPHVM